MVSLVNFTYHLEKYGTNITKYLIEVRSNKFMKKNHRIVSLNTQNHLTKPTKIHNKKIHQRRNRNILDLLNSTSKKRAPNIIVNGKKQEAFCLSSGTLK